MVDLLRAARTVLAITRPRFWFYTAGPFLLGYMAGLKPPRDLLTPEFWLPFLYFLLPANLYIYGINDLYDRDTDARNAKKQAQEHLLTSQELRWLQIALVAVLVLSLALFLSLPDLTAGLLFILFVTLCTVYSASPLRLKARPFFDSYSNLLYVLPGFLAFYLTAHSFPPLPILIGAALWAAGMHAYSALPDIEPDRETGIRTIAVALGERGGLVFVLVNWLGFAILVGLTLRDTALLAFIYPLIPLFLLVRPEVSIRKVYWWFPYVNALIGFLAFLALSLS